MVVDSTLHVEIPELSKQGWKELEHKLTFVNEAGEVVIGYRKLLTRGYYKLPRGAWYLLPDSIRYTDNRVCPSFPKLDFKVKLNDVEKDERFHGQAEAVQMMLQEEQGLIIRPPGTGKTQIALAFAAECQTSVLVIVHTKDILDQWVNYIENAIPEMTGKVGIIQGRKAKFGQITVGTIQTLNRLAGEKPPAFWEKFGAVIVDEAHHVAAPSWENVLNTIPAKYRFGFSANRTRADGMQPAMKWVLGPIIHWQKFSSPIPLEVVPVNTNFYMPYRGAFDWPNLLNKLVADPERNRLIAKHVQEELDQGNAVLVLSRRIEQLELIQEILGAGEILTGKRSSKDRKAILSDFRKGNLRVLFATQLADEALDVPRLNRVFLTHPGKFEGRLIQQIGRAIREHPDKDDAKVYDFVDKRVGVLRHQFSQRRRAYKTAKISIKSSGRMRWR